MLAASPRPGRLARLLPGFLAGGAVCGLLLSVLLVGLKGSPIGYAIGGVTGPGIASAACAAALAIVASVVLRRRARRWWPAGALVLVTAGCLVFHGCAGVRSFVIEPLVVTSGDVSIAGEFYVPDGRGPFPAVIIVPGSAGSQPVTRDSQFGLYRAAADKFAEAGVAAFVYDRRGSGDSTGDRRSALLADHAADVVAIGRRLAAHDGIRSDAIGVWGISAGTWVAALAARDEPFAFLVLVSAPAECEGRQRLYEWSQRLEREGLAQPDIERLVDLRWRIWRYLATGAGYDDVKADYEAARQERWWPQLDHVIFPRWLASPGSAEALEDSERRWLLTDMMRDPLDVLDGVAAPILVIYGGRDVVIPMPRSRRTMQTHANRTGGAMIVRAYERANHGLVELTLPPRFPDDYWPDTIRWVYGRTR